VTSRSCPICESAWFSFSAGAGVVDPVDDRGRGFGIFVDRNCDSVDGKRAGRHAAKLRGFRQHLLIVADVAADGVYGADSGRGEEPRCVAADRDVVLGIVGRGEAELVGGRIERCGHAGAGANVTAPHCACRIPPRPRA
jgi:hypothetical protein